MSKLITVFGATGNQGGSVIAAIQADEKLAKEYKIRGITRDTSKPAAKALSDKGVEVVSADMNSVPSIAAAIKGSHTVFLVTNYWESAKSEVEIAQGTNVTQAAKEAKVTQMIFSSLVNVTEVSNGRLTHVEHFDGKARIEQYIRDSGMMCTFVLPGFFMQNWTTMFQKGDDGNFNGAFPVTRENAKFPLIDISADFGKFAVPALREPEKFNGKQILAAQDYYTIERAQAELKEVTGKTLNYTQVSDEQFMSSLPSFMAREMLENLLLMEDPGYYAGADLNESHGYVQGKLTSWKDFVAKAKFFN